MIRRIGNENMSSKGGKYWLMRKSSFQLFENDWGGLFLLLFFCGFFLSFICLICGQNIFPKANTENNGAYFKLIGSRQF